MKRVKLGEKPAIGSAQAVGIAHVDIVNTKSIDACFDAAAEGAVADAAQLAQLAGADSALSHGASLPLVFHCSAHH